MFVEGAVPELLYTSVEATFLLSKAHMPARGTVVRGRVSFRISSSATCTSAHVVERISLGPEPLRKPKITRKAALSRNAGKLGRQAAPLQPEVHIVREGTRLMIQEEQMST